MSLDQILALPGIWRGAALATTAHPGVATGFAKLDRELPGTGWPVGALTELLHDEAGIGEFALVAPALSALTRAGRWVAIVAPPHRLYAPALAQMGIAIERVLVIEPANTEALWSIEQTLRSNVCAALLGWPPTRMKYSQLRRLQLAAEGSAAMALLFRPRAASREASPAALRIELAPTFAGALILDIVKRRGLAAAAPFRLDPRTPSTAPPAFQTLAHVIARLPVDAHAAVDRHRFTALSARRVPAGESIN